MSGPVVVFGVTYGGVQGSRGFIGTISGDTLSGNWTETGTEGLTGTFTAYPARSATTRQPQAGGLFAALGLFLFRRLRGFPGGLGPGYGWLRGIGVLTRPPPSASPAHLVTQH